MTKHKIIILFEIIIFILPLVNADSTFFDDPNDSFIMGRTSITSEAAPTSQQTDGSSAGGSSCPAGYKFTGEKCINVSSSSGLNASKKVNQSSIVVPPIHEPEQGDEKNKTEEVEELQLIIEKLSAVPAKMDKNKLLYNILIGIVILFVICILFLLKRKKRPPISTKYLKIWTE